MAYGGQSTVPYFSNPEVLYNGVPTGAVDGYDATNDETVDPRLSSGGISDLTHANGYDGRSPLLGALNAHILMEKAPLEAMTATRTLSLEILEPAIENLGLASTEHGLQLFADSVNADLGDGEILWEHLSGPGSVQFANHQSEKTSAIFTQEGIHKLRVTATEGEVQLAADLRVTVGRPTVTSLPPEVGWWTFDEPSGNLALDSTTPANNGTLNEEFESTTRSTGIRGNALFFDDTKQNIIIPDSDDLDGFEQASFTFWVFPTTHSNTLRGLIGKRYLRPHEISYSLYLGTENRLAVDLTPESDDDFYSSASLLPNEWTHVAVVFDGTQSPSERLRIYLNGELDSTHELALNQINSTSYDLSLGNYRAFFALYAHHGGLDDVRIYSRPLNQEEINEVMSGIDTQINYGPEITLTVAGTAEIDKPLPISASVQNDDLPEGGPITHQWSGTQVDILDVGDLSTTATFTQTGQQSIRFSASDGEITTFKATTVDVVQLLKSYADWANNIDWQGRDSGSNSTDNLHNLPNLILFAMDLHPLMALPEVSLPRVVQNNDDSLTFTYRRNKVVKDLIFYPEYSDDLTTWHLLDPANANFESSTLDSNIDGDGSAELIQVKVKDPAAKTLFFRLSSELE